MNSHLKNAIIEKFRCDDSAYAFLNNIMTDAIVYLFGGAIRDFLDGNLEFSRDVDFVIEANSTNSLDIENYLKEFTKITYKKNRYDGYKIIFNKHLTVDIWNLSDTWAFKTNKLIPSATNLMKSVYLNVDALVYSLNSDSFLDNCDITYSDIIKNHLLDIVFEETPFEDLNLLRALVLKKKYSLELSSKLSRRLMHYIENEKTSVIDNFMNLQIAHYNQVILDQMELSRMLYYLETC